MIFPGADNLRRWNIMSRVQKSLNHSSQMNQSIFKLKQILYDLQLSSESNSRICSFLIMFAFIDWIKLTRWEVTKTRIDKINTVKRQREREGKEVNSWCWLAEWDLGTDFKKWSHKDKSFRSLDRSSAVARQPEKDGWKPQASHLIRWSK